MRFRIFAGLVAVTAASLFAQTAKEPWKWTTEQRLHARFDPEARKARLAEAAARAAQRTGMAAHVDDIDVIDGDVHPELFLPSELFESFVFLRVLKPQWVSDELDEKSDDLLRSEAERTRFAALTSAYGALLLRERALLTEKSKAGSRRAAEIDGELLTLRKDKRTAGAAALRDARKAFGLERFDRFLYTVVAPGRKKFVLRGSDDTVTAKALREREEQPQ